YLPLKSSLFTRVQHFFHSPWFSHDILGKWFSHETIDRWFPHPFLAENSFTRDKEKISIFFFKHVGIRGILLDKKLTSEKQITHPNFQKAGSLALMSDNTKRPVGVIDLPAEIIADIEDPSKYVVVR
ncbi:MAG: hypothetical protein ACNA7Y_05220, partial [Gammaproteobacteria bacterium]